MSWPAGSKPCLARISIWNCRITAWPSRSRVNPMLIAMSKELEIPLVITNDSHYIRKEDARAQEILMCLQMGRTRKRAA